MTALLTPTEVSSRLRIKVDRVRSLIKSGQLRGISVSPPGTRRPRYRVDPVDLQAFENSRTISTKPQPRRRKRPAKDVISFF